MPSFTVRRVRGVLFADYVRIIRRQVASWREKVAPEDRALLEQHVDLEQWYPMDTFERLGLIILEHVVAHETDAIRLWGREQVQAVLSFFPELANPSDPRDSVMRFQNFLASLFDFPAVVVESVEDEAALVRVEYGMHPAAEEAASWQTVGFFEELLTASGARQVSGSLRSRAWAGDAQTIAALSWVDARHSPQPFLTHPRVLLVDDERLVARGLVRQLGRDVDVTIAGSAAVALEFLALQEFDAVVSDFHMPDRDGLSLLEEVALRWPKVKRVLHSGSMPAHARDAVARGVVHELLEKPASRDVLISAVSTPISTR